MGRRFAGNNFLYITPLHAKGLRCRSCNKVLHHPVAVKEYEKKKKEQPNFELENNKFPWSSNLQAQDPFNEPNVGISELKNYLKQITTSYGVPNLMKVFDKDLRHDTPSDVVVQFHSNFQWHALNSPNAYDMRCFGYILSLNPASELQWRTLISEHSEEILTDQLHDEDALLFESLMAVKFQQKVDLVNRHFQEQSMRPPKLIEICPDSWTTSPTAIDQ